MNTPFYVRIQNSSSGQSFIVKIDGMIITLEATKENWRWIEHEAKERGIPVKVPDGMYESWPESGQIRLTNATKLTQKAPL
jgi:hypothetical protein